MNPDFAPEPTKQIEKAKKGKKKRESIPPSISLIVFLRALGGL
jgi:hypothetical protein